jgi:hypothetical protein
MEVYFIIKNKEICWRVINMIFSIRISALSNDNSSMLVV